MRNITDRAAAIAAFLFASSTTCAAAQHVNSPHVEGDNASVSVVYHQEVTHRTEKRVVYEGPSVDRVRRVLETVLSERMADLTLAIQSGDDQKLLSSIQLEMNRRFANSHEILAAMNRAFTRAFDDIRARIDAVQADTDWIVDTLQDKQPRRAYVGLTGLWTGVTASPGNFGSGGHVRGDVYVFVAGGAKLRHMIGFAAAYELFSREELLLDPKGAALERTPIASHHIWSQPGYEVWWFMQQSIQLAFRGGLALGAQRFSSGRAADWALAIGPALATECRFAVWDRIGGRVGLEWSPQSVLEPVYAFRGFEADASGVREWQHYVRAYVGIYVGFGSLI